MRWTVLVELTPESVGDWTLHPKFTKEEGLDEQERVFWTVGLTHKHGSALEHCSVVNKEDVHRWNATPEYECGKCGQRAPNSVVIAKANRLVRLRGTDPRNDRRGAILATQKKHK